MDNLLISRSNSPTFVSGWLVFITARVSAPVYTTKPTADPAASTVFDQRTFSAVRGEMEGGKACSGKSLPFLAKDTGGLFKVKVPMKEWISLIGASAEIKIRIALIIEYLTLSVEYFLY